MSFTYPYSVVGVVDVPTKLTIFDSRMLIDLDLETLYINSVYDNVNEIVNVNFNTELTPQQNLIVNNVVNIIFFDLIPGLDVYIFNPAAFTRRSPNVVDPPT